MLCPQAEIRELGLIYDTSTIRIIADNSLMNHCSFKNKHLSDQTPLSLSNQQMQLLQPQNKVPIFLTPHCSDWQADNLILM